MRIGIDIRKFSDLGIGTYIQNLLAEFDRSHDHEWIYFVSPAHHAVLKNTYRGSFILNRSAKYSPFGLVSLARQANEANCDIFHAPHYTLPVGLSARRVVTIHDLIHIRVPGAVPPPERLYARMLLSHACRSADAVIVDSEYTKGDIVRTLRVDAAKIHVIHLGVAPVFRPAEGSNGDALRRLGIKRPYLLYSGALKPHKNVPQLLRAFADVSRTHDVDLVLTGEKLQDYGDLTRLVRELEIAHRVISVGRTALEGLVALYQHARALVLPSLYEGFGLSLIEAMACGTPVLGASATSIPEVVGNAGLLFDPRSRIELSKALDRVLTDDSLRQDLVIRGRARAAIFSWESCAQKTLGVYRKVAQGS